MRQRKAIASFNFAYSPGFSGIEGLLWNKFVLCNRKTLEDLFYTAYNKSQAAPGRSLVYFTKSHSLSMREGW